MHTRSALLLTLSGLMAVGCAVEMSSDLDLDTFSKSPDAVDVTGADKTVTCDMTVVGAGGAGGQSTVKYAACSFKSPQGRTQGCLATSGAGGTGDLWSCEVTIPADSEQATWTIEYVFVEDQIGGKFFATGAELVADVPNVMPTAGEVDLAVTSGTADITPPTILSFDPVSQDVYPGSPVKCRIVTDEDPVEVVGCTFLPDDSSASISCISASGSDTCFANVPGSVSVGVVYNEVNHFARDAALNVTVGDANQTFTVVSPPTTGNIAVDMALLPAQCTGASWSISPGGLSGTTDLAPTAIAPGDYTITWNDTALGCTNPTTELKTVLVDQTTTFDFASINYTTRSTFGPVNTDVGVDGNYGVAPPSGGAWSIESDLLPLQFTATGTGDVTDISPSLGDFYTGRAYTLTWAPEANHTTPGQSAITTSGTYQGNYIDLGADACAGFTVDYSANNAWSATSDAGATATDDVTFDFYARPSVANQNALLAVAGVTPIDEFNDAAMLFQFGSNGFIQVRDGAGYCGDTERPPCDNAIPYVPGEWYHFVVNASIGTQSYTTQVETCDDGLVTVMTDAAFRDIGTAHTSVEYHAAWENSGNAIDINFATEGSWTPGVCTPTHTCANQGYECGTPLDDCGDPLSSCGTCTAPDVCFPEGTCCTPSTTVCTDPTPDYECGDWNDGCGGTVNCGSCPGGQACVQGYCQVEGTGVPYDHVVPADIGFTVGVGVVAPVPTEAYTGPSTITVDGTTIENKVINSAISIQANNVTIRNCVIDNDPETATRTVRIGTVCDPPGCTTVNNILLEYNRIVSVGDNIKVFGINYGTNVTIRNNDIDGGADLFQNNRDIDGLLFEDNVWYGMNGSAGVHFDGFQIGSSCTAPCFVSGTVMLRGNYFAENRPTIPDSLYNDLFFGDSGGAGNTVDVTYENNYLAPWGKYTFRCYDNASCTIRNNVYGEDFQFRFENYSGSGPKNAMLFRDNNAAASSFECNRYEASGDIVPEVYLINDTGTDPIGNYRGTNCPSYRYPTALTTGITDEWCPDWNAKKSTYAGPETITVDGTIIEYKEITDGKLNIEADNVEVRCVSIAGVESTGVLWTGDNGGGSNTMTDLIMENVFVTPNVPLAPGMTDTARLNAAEGFYRRMHVVAACDVMKGKGGLLLDNYMDGSGWNPDPDPDNSTGEYCNNFSPHFDAYQIHGQMELTAPYGGVHALWLVHNNLQGPYQGAGQAFIDSDWEAPPEPDNITLHQNWVGGGGRSIYITSENMRATYNEFKQGSMLYGPFYTSTAPSCLEIHDAGVHTNFWDVPDNGRELVDASYFPGGDDSWSNMQDIGDCPLVTPIPTWTISSPSLSSTSCTAGVDCGTINIIASASGNGTATLPPYTGSSPRWRYRCGQSATQMWNKADGVAGGTLEDPAETSTTNCNGLSSCTVVNACDFTSTGAGTYTVKIYSEPGPGAGIRRSDHAELTFTVN